MASDSRLKPSVNVAYVNVRHSERQPSKLTRIYTRPTNILRLYQRLWHSRQYSTLYHFFMRIQPKKQQNIQNAKTRKHISTTTEDLYKNRSNGDKVFIDIPGAKGIEVFIITGPELLDVVKKYNLLSGGGCLPPMWGLGFKYRVKGDAIQDSVMRFADYFRNNHIPCDVLGLEPGWQTATYSCSYIWSKERFPQHKEMLAQLQQKGYKINLWEHAYVHPTSPIRKALEPYLYTAFRTYQQEGIPPFRPLLMDDPKDERLRTISDQYMIGNGMMAAPLYENKKSRKVYFPEGVWYNFNTNEKYEGNREYEITTELNQLPLYVRQGTLLPLAEPVPYINTQTVFNLNCKIYGTPTATC